MTDQQLKAWELNLQQARDIVTARKYAQEIAETQRHNVAYESETHRHNRATEEAALQQIGVAWHQAESARTTAQANWRNADTNRYNAEVNRYNADINAWNAATNERNAAANERNAATNWYNAETNRAKLDVDWYNAYTNREALGPAWLSAQGAYMRGQAGMLSGQAALRNAEYNWMLGQLNYDLGMYRAETDRYGTVMNAGSNRMQAQAQRRNAQTREYEYKLSALNSETQRALWNSQMQHTNLLTDIDRTWGYQKAKADAYDKMANAMYKSRLSDMESQKWASSTALGIISAATRIAPYSGALYDPNMPIYNNFKGIDWSDERSGIWLYP